MPFELLSNRSALSGYLATFFHAIIVVAQVFYLPVFFQAVLGTGPTASLSGPLAPPSNWLTCNATACRTLESTFSLPSSSSPSLPSPAVLQSLSLRRTGSRTTWAVSFAFVHLLFFLSGWLTVPASTLSSGILCTAGMGIMSLMDVRSRINPLPNSGKLTTFSFLIFLKVNSPKKDWVGFQIVVSVGMGIIYAAPQFPILASLPVSQTAHALSFFTFVSFLAGFASLAEVVAHDLLLPTTGPNIRSSLGSDSACQTTLPSRRICLTFFQSLLDWLNRAAKRARKTSARRLPGSVPRRIGDHLRRHPDHQEHSRPSARSGGQEGVCGLSAASLLVPTLFCALLKTVELSQNSLPFRLRADLHPHRRSWTARVAVDARDPHAQQGGR